MLVLSPSVTGPAPGELSYTLHWRIEGFLNVSQNQKSMSCSPFQFGERCWTAKFHKVKIHNGKVTGLIGLKSDWLQKQHPGSMLPAAPVSGLSTSQDQQLVRVSYTLCPARTSSIPPTRPGFTREDAWSEFIEAKGRQMPLECDERLLKEHYLDASGCWVRKLLLR